ncbi:MAG: hypothetical protein HYU85_08490 [Chloroflexi bacterium]|nr:hypothetical protein [Chloroflexota bacterium]MBI3931501.1 hypothetical protein [Chloroflexota bacterium]
MEKRELVRFYFDTISYHTELEQWYRAFFLAFEATVLASITFAIVQKNQGWIVGLGIVGLLLTCLAIWSGKQRGNIVDRQRNKLKEILWDVKEERETDVEQLAECFEMYNPDKTKVFAPGAQNVVPRLVFNLVVPIAIGFALIFILLGGWNPLWIPLAIIGYLLLFIFPFYHFLPRLGVPKDFFKRTEIKKRYLKWLNPIIKPIMNFGLKE